jgi:hypothetical protein
MSIDSALIWAKKWLLLTHSKTRCSRSLVTILHHHKSVVKKVNKPNPVKRTALLVRTATERARAASIFCLSLRWMQAKEPTPPLLHSGKGELYRYENVLKRSEPHDSLWMHCLLQSHSLTNKQIRLITWLTR